MPTPRSRAALRAATASLVVGLATATIASAQPGAARAQAQSKTSVKPPASSAAASATPADRIKAPAGFRVELIHTVARDAEGSWVSLAVDPKGRLIASDQYGKLFRITPPPPGGPASATKVEPIAVEIGEAQGLLWAFDSLYVVVNSGGKFPSGLYRVRDTDGDDRLDKVEKLRPLDGGGEHGPHAVILAPDGKSLYVVAGNATKLPDLAGSLVPRVWGEDNLLPRMTDGRGFMRDEKAPGGFICRVDPDGKSWELLSMGYRNAYDIAFNRHGDLFTYDSDMEWDMNTPWYRPTRVCVAASGTDLGYRNGAGKWPAYYPDSIPPVVNIGPGSPTGVTFGYGAKFPAKYQEALFISDWSYGKLYAVHLKPKGSAYAADVEEFITGSPLPLTDLLIHPGDGAMYFAIGGRKTTSGLYRVTYAGPEPTAPSKGDDAGAQARAERRRLEAFHGHRDPKAVEVAWPYLANADRFLRSAARIAIEHQDPATWRDRALVETHPQASLEALLALVRVSASDPAHRGGKPEAADPGLKAHVLAALDRLSWDSLSPSQRIDLVRVYSVLFNRTGPPDAESAARIVARLDPAFPSRGRELNVEVCNLLVYLQAPGVAAKSVDLLTKAPTQEEQIDYARALRVLKAGWTPGLRARYFGWFASAARFKGGASFGGFLANIRRDALATLSDSEKQYLKPILDAPVEKSPGAAVVASRTHVKDWTVDELIPVVEAGVKRGRDFDRGRSLFAATQCFSCHRYDNEGGSAGPDLTGVSGRFGTRDLLESMILPSKVISDQYEAVVVATTDGRVVTGRVVNLNGDNMAINTNMLDPNEQVNVDRRKIEEIKPSRVSMMPEGLLNTLDRDEVLDLVAYLLSRGDRESPMFR